MKTTDFDFILPHELIAQNPLDKRDNSKLLILTREKETISHNHFYDIVDYLEKDSVLVLNDTKVLPARLIGKKAETNAIIEVLLLHETIKNAWECLVKPAKRVKIGTIVFFGNTLKAKCIAEKQDGIRIFEMIYEGIFIEILEALGEMPLPPYITEKLADKSRYQTVYAKEVGSAAAPTAGLHFTNDLIEKIKAKGIEIINVTLHVGLGTFRPVMTENIDEHQMHEEKYIISNEACNSLNNAIASGKKIICCGTTTVRIIESNFNIEKQKFTQGIYNTSIFIYPGYHFKIVSGIITNFHLPKSSLVMLVSAFATKDFIKKAYEIAVEAEYRFFSFGDAMFIK